MGIKHSLNRMYYRNREYLQRLVLVDVVERSVLATVRVIFFPRS